MSRALAALCLALAAAAPALAQGLFGKPIDYARVTLHAGWAEGEGGRRMAGLRMELAPGWKTYWRNPGDTGVPPRFDWSGSENLAAARILWPAPHVFPAFGLNTLGYKERMVLPLELTPRDPTKPIKVRLAFTYGVCKDICIPSADDLALDIAPGAPADGAPFIRSALDARPATAAEAGVAASCDVAGAGAERSFRAALTFPAAPRDAPMVVVEGPEGVWIGPAQTRLDGRRLSVEAPVETEAGRWIDRQRLAMTVVSPEGAVSIEGCAG